MEKYLKSNLCHLPWTSIETRANGRYKPCCIYRDDLKEDGVFLNTKQHTITQVMNSKPMQELRNSFLAGERPKGCESCWKEEATGKTSKRQHMWLKAGLYGEVQIKKNLVSPRYIDLKLGDVCNLKCRICAPNSSSQWVNDMIKLDPHQKERWINYNKMGFWPREKNKFFDDISNHIESIRFFEITGGEPFMIQEQFDILQQCIDNGVANKIDVHYNTNGTHFPEHAIENIWPHFKRIEIAFSIDDIGKRFEYQRYPAKWEQVNDNIKKFKKGGLNNLTWQICTTINIFNIMYIDDLAIKVKEWNPDFWHINILHMPVEFDIQRLPLDVKKVIKDKVKNCNTYKTEIESAINYMMNEPQYVIQNHKDALVSKIKSIDELRGENFAETFYELNNLLKIYD